MPVDGLAPRYRELGRLKFGEDLGDRPGQLKTWRLTSKQTDLIEAAARLYGGRAQYGDDSAELITETATLDVVIPPQDIAAGQWFELWGAGGLARRCTGSATVAVSHDGTWTETGPCECDPDRRACKLRTVLRVLLPELPDLGVWRLSTGSAYAAAEIPPAVQAIVALNGGNFAPAVLGLEERTTKKPGQKPHHYMVPTLSTRATLGQLIADARLGEIEASDHARPRAQIGSAPPESPPGPTEAVRGVVDSPKPEPDGIRPEWAELARFLHDSDAERLLGLQFGEAVAILDELETRMVAVRLWKAGAVDAAAKKEGLPDNWRDGYLTAKVRQLATRALLAAVARTFEDPDGYAATQHHERTHKK